MITKKLPKILMFGSGTNIGRVAKAARKVEGFVSVPYRLKEKNDPGTVQRRFARLNLSNVEGIENYSSQVNGFQWNKVFKNPLKASNTLKSIVQSLFSTGESNDGGLQLSTLTTEGETFEFQCVMLWCSANNKQLGQFSKQVEEWVPNSIVQVFNSEFTNNREVEEVAKKIVAQAKTNGKRVIFISNTMASRSFSVSEVEASLFMFDRGSIGSTEQKGSRCLTNGTLMNGKVKEFAWIISLSIDPNRTDSLTEMQLMEAQRVSKAEEVDFVSALKDVLNTLNIFSDRYGTGTLWQADVQEVLFELQDCDKLVSLANACASFKGMSLEELSRLLTNVGKSEGRSSALNSLLEKVKTQVTLKPGSERDPKVVNEIRAEQRDLAAKIASLNESALTVGDYTPVNSLTYREALSNFDQVAEGQFQLDYGVSSEDVLELLDNGVLAEHILDMVVNNQSNSVQFTK